MDRNFFSSFSITNLIAWINDFFSQNCLNIIIYCTFQISHSNSDIIIKNNISIKRCKFFKTTKRTSAEILFPIAFLFSLKRFRPISVLSPFSKIFENIIYKRLNKYLTRHNIRAKQQCGFRAKHSANHVIADVTNKLQNYHDNKHFTCLILLDLSKAFDTVDHQIVLNKLEKYRIRVTSCNY